jgi:hypothetical protein
MVDHVCEPISSTGLASSRLRRAPQDGVKTSLTLYRTKDEIRRCSFRSRGVKPADIPIEQQTNFEIVINLKIAQAIGYKISSGRVLRADKLVE